MKNKVQIAGKSILIAIVALLAACAAQSPIEDAEPDADAPSVGEIGGMCGGIAGFQCKDDAAYCNVEPGLCVDVADYAGECALKPEICTMEYAPVCGCDGNTYSNACSAAGKGASVAYEGECEAGE